MAAIDLLPASGRAVSSKPTSGDVGNDPVPTSTDAGNSPFGTVLSDSMRPAPRKDNSTGTREQTSSPAVDAKRTNPQGPASQSSPSENRSAPTSRTDSRRASGTAKPGKKDQDPSTAPAPKDSTPGSLSEAASSDSTLESEVANVQQDQQQTNSDSTAATLPADAAPPPQGAAPAQLVAGLLIASTQTQPASPTVKTTKTPQNSDASVASAVSNVQKAPVGLAAALEQAVTTGDQDKSGPAPGAQQPATTPAEIEQSSAIKAAPTGPAPPQPAATPLVVDAANKAQAAASVVPQADLKASDETKDQSAKPGLEEAKGPAPRAEAPTQAQPARELPAVSPTTAASTSTPAPVVQTLQVAAGQSEGASANDAKPTDDPLAHQKSGGDPQATFLSSTGNVSESGAKDPGSLADLSSQPKSVDPASGNPNEAIGKGQTVTSEQSSSHLKDDDSGAANDPASSVQGFATDYGARRTEGPPAAAATGSDRSVNPAQVLDQVAHGIQVSHQSGERMQLHLRPPELGNVQIDVSMRDGMLSARLEAQSPATHQLLSDNLSQLKDSLAQQGVQVDRLEVGLSDSMRSDVSTGGFSGRSFEQQQQRDDMDPGWEQSPANAPQRRAQPTEVRVTSARNAGGQIMSLDITV